MAQACLATLLRLDDHTDDANVFPLVKYAAKHWVDHAQFGEVSSRVQDGMYDLFDSSKSHFAAWHQVHDVDEIWYPFSYYPRSRDSVGSPLYYAAFCGFHDLAERLITKHPEQVNARNGYRLFPLPAALSKRHLHVANLLYLHGAVVDVRGNDEDTPLFAASFYGDVDIIRWLLSHGANANAFCSGFTSLFEAADKMHLDAVQILLEHNADVNLQNKDGDTPLYWILSSGSWMGKLVDMVRRLLEHGADPNICNNDHRTPLHEASSHGLLEAARLLLRYGAKVDEKDEEGKTPYEQATSDEMTKLLVEHGAVPPP